MSKSRSVLRIIVVCCAMLTAAGAARAATEVGQQKMSCPQGGGCQSASRITFYADDCGGPSFAIWVHCDCSITVHFLQRVGGIGPTHLPPNWQQLEAQADLTTPGAYTGFYLLDSLEQPVPFFNPLNQGQIDAMYSGECVPGIGFN